jgi:hypothetical protein
LLYYPDKKNHGNFLHEFGNFASIDGQSEGTMLHTKNPTLVVPKYHVLVTSRNLYYTFMCRHTLKTSLVWNWKMEEAGVPQVTKA